MLSSSCRRRRQPANGNFWIIAVFAVTVTLWSGSIASVNGAPAKLDSNETPLPLELQAPLVADAATYDDNAEYNGNGRSNTAIDSYGNPIESLQPIDTPDGRKVVSAQGLQFEIPNYASGITEIKKPADDLLPPFIGELSTSFNAPSDISTDDDDQSRNNGGIEAIENDDEVIVDDHDHDHNNGDDYGAGVVQQQESNVRFDDKLQHTYVAEQQSSNDQQQQQQQQQQQSQQQQQHTTQTNDNNNNYNNVVESQQPSHDIDIEHQQLYYASSTLTTDAPSYFSSPTNLEINPNIQYYSSSPYSDIIQTSHNSSPSIYAKPTPLKRSQTSTTAHQHNSQLSEPSLSPASDSITSTSSANTYSAPLSNDPIAVAVPNEASVEVSTTAGTGTSSGETTTVDVENAHLVKLKPNYHEQQQQQSASAHAPKFVETTATSNPLTASNQIPSYLLSLNDPDIGGPVDYVPAEDGSSLKVIAWDLLPPHPDNEPTIITKDHNPAKHVVGVVDPNTHNIKVSLTSGQGLNPFVNVNSHPTEGKVSVVDLNHPVAQSTTLVNNYYTSTTPRSAYHAGGTSGSGERIQISLGSRGNTDLRQPSVSNVHVAGNNVNNFETTTKRNSNQYNQRGNVYYTQTTPKLTTTKATTTTTTTTTTTRRPTTTTTRRATTTTTRRAITTTTARTTPLPSTTSDPSQFYKLEAGDSYTLPSWLADLDYPDLDAAVTFIVPTDLNEYNHTIDRDLIPPLEPFVDLNNIHLTSPKTTKVETTTKYTPTTTTRRTTPSTTTTSSTTTTTRRPTVPTVKSHWVRANPTPSTPKPISSISNDRFHSTNFAQMHNVQPATSSSTYTGFKSSTAPVITTTAPQLQTRTTYTPSTLHQQQQQHQQQQHSNAFNQNLPTATVDLITSGEAEPTQPPARKFNPGNPFLPAVHHNNGAYNPKPFSKSTTTTTTIPTTSRPTTSRPTTTTTTTTTTTPAPISNVDANPFDSATIPPWLSEFDYPDVGPGVPFVYDPVDPELDVAKNLLPPSTLDAQATDSAKPVFVTTSPKSFNSFPATPQGFTPQTTNSASAPTSSVSSSFPSKVTLPLPSIPVNRQNNPNAATQPPIVFIPPPVVGVEGESNFNVDNTNTNANLPQAVVPNDKKNPSSSFHKNFAAPFEPSAVGAPTTPPNTFDQETFPPFATRDDGVPTKKTTFTKSEDGKVLTNNLFLQGAASTQQQQQQTTKPFGVGNVFSANKNNFQASASNQFLSSTTTSGFSASTTNSFGSFSNGKTSTPSGFANRAPQQQTNSFGGSGFVSSASTTTAANVSGNKFSGSFGGPPGVLSGGNVGFGVQQANSNNDGAIRASATAGGASFAQPQPPKPAFNGFASQAGRPANANRYSGRFGGPPGVLNV